MNDDPDIAALEPSDHVEQLADAVLEKYLELADRRVVAATHGGKKSVPAPYDLQCSWRFPFAVEGCSGMLVERRPKDDEARRQPRVSFPIAPNSYKPLAEFCNSPRKGRMVRIRRTCRIRLRLPLCRPTMPSDHEIEIRVRYYETDAQGYVHHANYFQYFELARVEQLLALGHDYAELERDGIILVVTKIACRYHRPCRFGDTLRLQIRTVRTRGPHRPRIPTASRRRTARRGRRHAGVHRPQWSGATPARVRCFKWRTRMNGI